MRRLGSLLWVALGLFGCVAPRQYGGPIPVDQEGLADRMELLCRMDRSPGGGCVTPSDTSAEEGRPGYSGSVINAPSKLNRRCSP